MTIDEHKVASAVETAKLLGSPTRFKILHALMQNGSDKDFCVKEIASTVEMSHSATSHQLARLEDKGIVSSRRSGQTMCYTLNNTSVTKSLKQIIKDLS